MALNENPTLIEIVDEMERLNNLIVDRGGSQTITPTTSNKVLNKGYYKGNITVKGDTNLVSANILSGKSIFGVSGNVTVSSLGGKKWASGQVAITTSEYKTFYPLDGSSGVSGIRYLNISNLNFTPSIILAYCKVSNSLVYTTIYLNGLFTSVAYAGGWNSSNGGYIFKNDTNIVNGNVFTLPTKINSNTSYKFDWIAFE